MERIDKNGKRIPTRNETESSVPPKPLLPQWLNNILVIICTVCVLYTADPSGITPFGKALQMKSLIASLVIATLPPPSVATAMRPTTGQFDLPGIQIIEPTLEHYLSPDKMTFFPILGYIYKNCKI